MLNRRGFALFAFVAAVCLLLAIPSFADSQARIVRLSYIDGDVRINRNVGEAFEEAILNMPVIQGTRLYTGNDGRVEVEFENGSTVRLSGPSDLLFRQLTLRSSGDKVSMLDLREGLAYFNVERKGDDDFRFVIGNQEFRINKSARFRVRVDNDDVQLAVFRGEVEYLAPGREVEVKKNETLALDLRDPGRYFLSKNIDEYASDEWDSARDQYHDQYANAERDYRNDSPYASGWSDLNYYGNYFDAPGYGSVWRPYGVGYGWDPFSYGAWSWYPGFGWTYVSAYPWGWTPYRYGSWLYLANYGWCWRPSNSWNYWNTGPVIVRAPRNYVAPRVPTGRGGTIITGITPNPRRPTSGTRPAPPGGTPVPIARAPRLVVEPDRERPVQGRPSALRSGVSAGSSARQPIAIQPSGANQIPADNIRVAPTDMRPPARVDSGESVREVKPPEPRVSPDGSREVRDGRSSVFDRPRETDRTDRGGDSRATTTVPAPRATREVPRPSPAPEARPSVPSQRSVERSAPSAPAPAPRPTAAPSAPAPRSAMPSPSMPSAPRSSPSPSAAPRGSSVRR